MTTVTFNNQRIRVTKSTRKNKQLQAEFPDGSRIHFGDPTMREFPGTKRGDNFCARTSGIKGKNDPNSPNFWSRRFLWNCKDKKSMKRRTI